MPTDAAERLADRIIALVSDKLNLLIDKRNLTEVDSSLNVAEAVITSILPGRFEIQMAHARRRRNAFLPISTLPEEVLIHVLQINLASENPARNRFQSQVSYHMRRLTLGAVSFSWRECINHTPAFWAICSTEMPISLLKDCVMKFKDSPLTILCDVRSDHMDEFWDLVGPHSGRWVSASVRPCPALFAILEKGVPLLEDLHLDGLEPTALEANFIEPQFLPTTTFPSMKSLQLEDVSLPWKTPPFSNLTNIYLHRIKDLPFHVLLEMLEASPFLKSLTLVDMDTRHTEYLPDIPKIHLMELDELLLIFLDAQATNYLLFRLALPPLDRMHIITSQEQRLPYESLPSFILGSAAEILRSVPQYTIEVLNNMLGISSGRNIEIYAANVDLKSLRWWTTTLHDSHNLVPLVLKLWSLILPFDVHDVVFVADSFRSITLVIAPFMEIYTLFTLICIPSEKEEWILPSLTAIELFGYWEPTRIDEMITWLSRKLTKRYSSPGVRPLTRFIYDASEVNLAIEGIMTRIIAGVGGCKICRRVGDDVIEALPLPVHMSC